MRYFLLLLTAMYVVFAALQLNDPDPLLWVTLYLVPAAGVLSAAYCRLPRVVGWGLALAYGALAVWWWPGRYDGVFGPMNPHTTVEEARESLGLLIAAAGLALAGFVGPPDAPVTR